MFHNRGTNSKINRLHDRALRIVFNSTVSIFDQLLNKDKYFCIYHQNIWRPLIEIYNVLHDNSGNSFKEFFVRRESAINLSTPEMMIPSVKSVLKNKTNEDTLDTKFGAH